MMGHLSPTMQLIELFITQKIGDSSTEMANLVLAEKLQYHAFNKWDLCDIVYAHYKSQFILTFSLRNVCVFSLMLHSMSTNCPLIIIFQILSILT